MFEIKNFASEVRLNIDKYLKDNNLFKNEKKLEKIDQIIRALEIKLNQEKLKNSDKGYELRENITRFKDAAGKRIEKLE